MMAVPKLLLCLCLALCGVPVLTQKYCCLPNQYEVKCGASGAMSGERGHMAIISAVMPRMSMDITNKKFAIEEMVYSEGRSDNFTTIMDYNTHMAYVIHWPGKKCSKMPLPGSVSVSGQCIPKKAKYMGSKTLGSGKSSLKIDGYWMTIASRDPPYTLDSYIDVQSDGCIPVSEYMGGIWGKTEFKTGLQYYDFSSGIKDPAVFDVPSFCDKATLMEEGDMSEAGMMLMWKFYE